MKRKINPVRYKVRTFPGNYNGRVLYTTTVIRRKDIIPRVGEVIEIGKRKYMATAKEGRLVDDWEKYGARPPRIWVFPIDE